MGRGVPGITQQQVSPSKANYRGWCSRTVPVNTWWLLMCTSRIRCTTLHDRLLAAKLNQTCDKHLYEKISTTEIKLPPAWTNKLGSMLEEWLELSDPGSKHSPWAPSWGWYQPGTLYCLRDLPFSFLVLSVAIGLSIPALKSFIS